MQNTKWQEQEIELQKQAADAQRHAQEQSAQVARLQADLDFKIQENAELAEMAESYVSSLEAQSVQAAQRVAH